MGSERQLSIAAVAWTRKCRQSLLTIGALTPFLIGLPLTGCHRTLFSKDAPRTQFETYDLQRVGYVPLEQPDVFGRPQPALRARLMAPD